MIRCVVTLTLLSIVSCKNNSDKLVEFLSQKLLVGQPCQSVLYLSDFGCTSCNSKYANFIGTLKSSNVNIIVANKGTTVDLSVINMGEKNIYRDSFSKLEQEFPMVDGSSYIRMNNCKIDTVLNINIKNVDSVMKAILKLEQIK